MINESRTSRWQGVLVVLALCVLGLEDAASAETDRRRSERPNEIPVISGTAPTSVDAGQWYSFRPTASDADGDRLSFWIRNQPRWAKFDSRSGELRGTPTQPGTHSDVVIGVSDWGTSAALPPFTIQVDATTPRTDQPPVISGSPADAVVAEQTYAFQPSAADPEGAMLSFAVENRPVWANFDASTGRLSGTPSSAYIGTYGNIVISVTDGATFASLAPFGIEVSAVPHSAPVISGSPATHVTAGQPYLFTPAASDADGDRLSFSASNKPAWASFDAASGRLSGTPGSTHVGTYGNIVISVSDGQSSAALPAFSIQVDAAPNRAPTIAGTPAWSIVAGQSYSYTPYANDADGDPLTFSIQNRPAWAAFSSSTGRLSGTPTSTQVGTYGNIVISVSDGKASASLAPFSIEVTAVGNRAPTISGQPATTVTIGQAYSFTPGASDPDGDVLTFTIQNRPAWATFSPTTGRLSGVPTDAQAGAYANIVIVVSDGEASASLPAFTINVEQPANRSVTLSWQAPTLNEDGTPLTDLTGYQVHYGQAAGQYSQTLSLPSASLTSVTIEDLAPATWHFAVKAVNAAGAQSSFSNEAWKTLE